MNLVRYFRVFVVVFAASTFMLAGCNSPDDGNRIVGTWRIVELAKVADRVVADQDADRQGFDMTIQFYRSGVLETVTAIGSINSTKEGTWRFLEYNEATNTMKIECTLQSQTTEHEIEFESDKVIRWIPPNMAGTSSKIRFERD